MSRFLYLLIALLIPGLASANETVEYDSIEDVPIWRLEILVHTSTASNADTDDWVHVTMHGSPLYPGETAYLDKGGDDREKDQNDIYQVFLPDVATVGDIDMLMLEKHSDDKWCFDRLYLQINHQYSPIFEKTWPGDGHCIDNGDGLSPRLVITGDELRDSPEWSLDESPWVASLPDYVNFMQLQRWIECAGGDGATYLIGLDYGDKDGPNYVDVSPVDAYYFDVDMDFSRWNGLWHDEWDFSTELGMDCVDGELQVTLEPDWDGVFDESFARFETTLMRLNDLAAGDYECAGGDIDQDGYFYFEWEEVDHGWTFPTWPGGANQALGTWKFAK